MADINQVATQFATFYYTQFDKNRASLSELYRPTSMLSFEGDQSLGATAIIEKLLSLRFQDVVHHITTLDAQPFPNGISVLVTGELLVDGGDMPIKFSQLFNLIQDTNGFYVLNDVFRLNLS